MASTGKTGRGVTFEIGNGASPTEVFTEMANVSSISLTGRETAEIDFTNLSSEGGYREFRQGFKDPGSIALDLQLDPNDPTHVNILELFNSGETFNWRINFTGTTADPEPWPFALVGRGYFSNPGDVTVNVDNPIGGTATVRCSGQSEFVDIP